MFRSRLLAPQSCANTSIVEASAGFPTGETRWNQAANRPSFQDMVLLKFVEAVKQRKEIEAEPQTVNLLKSDKNRMVMLSGPALF